LGDLDYALSHTEIGAVSGYDSAHLKSRSAASMPRRLRIALPNVPMHIIQRGKNRTACFYSTQDYDLYLRSLAELASRFACHIHAFVLMTNHVHLLLTPESREAPSMLMKHLGQRYAQYLNWTRYKTRRTATSRWEAIAFSEK
jgi:putative transposase